MRIRLSLTPVRAFSITLREGQELWWYRPNEIRASPLNPHSPTTQSVLFSNPTNFDQSRDMNKCRYGAARVPEPDVLAEEIIEKLEAGLNSFRTVLSSLRKGA